VRLLYLPQLPEFKNKFKIFFIESIVGGSNIFTFFLNIFIEVTKLQPPPTKSETFPAYDTHNGPCHDGERPLGLYFFLFFLNIFIEVTKLQPPPTKSETFPAYDTQWPMPRWRATSRSSLLPRILWLFVWGVFGFTTK
jgi:hypothetical protein